MSYATYNFYTSVYYGDMLDEAGFNKFASRASDYIDRVTFGRAAKYTDDNDYLAKACCAAADQLSMIESARMNVRDGDVASESVGSHSISYRSGVETGVALEKQLYGVVLGYLAPTGLMYRGVHVVRSASCHADDC